MQYKLHLNILKHHLDASQYFGYVLFIPCKWTTSWMKSVRPQEWRPAAQGKATSAMQVAAGFWTFEKKAAPLAKRGRGVVNEKATSLQVRSQNYLALSLCCSSILGHCLYHMALLLKTCSMWMCCCQRFACDYNWLFHVSLSEPHLSSVSCLQFHFVIFCSHQVTPQLAMHPARPSLGDVGDSHYTTSARCRAHDDVQLQ